MITGIAKILQFFSPNVSETIAEDNVDREVADHLQMRRVHMARIRGQLGIGPPRSPEFKIARMKSLRDLGIGYAAIATIMEFDFPDDEYTADDVREIVLAARDLGWSQL